MNKDEFLKQSAEDMTVSELAEAIKLKIKANSCPAPQPFKVGDRVKVVRNIPADNLTKKKIGDRFTISEIEESQIGGIGDWIHSDDGNETSIHAIELDKEEWKDITKECEFKLGSDVEGSYFLGVYYKGKRIISAISAGCISHPLEVVATLTREYKVLDYNGKPLDRTTNFKILKKVI